MRVSVLEVVSVAAKTRVLLFIIESTSVRSKWLMLTPVER